jgi:hypothetical protein
LYAVRPIPDTAWKWPLIWGITALFGGFAWLAWRYFGPIGFLLTVPFIGIVGAHWLVEGGAAGIRWLSWMPYAQWQGRYIAFEGQHLRYVEIDDALWFVDRDILAVIGLARGSARLGLVDATQYARIEGTPWFGLSQAGIERLLLKSPHPLAAKFLLWLRRDVFAPHQRRVEQNP